MWWKRSRNMNKPHGTSISPGRKRNLGSGISHHHGIPGSEKNSSDMSHMILSQKKCWWYKAVWGQTGQLSLRYGQTTKQEDKMFPSYLPVKAPDPGAYHFNFLGHNQKCLTVFSNEFSTQILCRFQKQKTRTLSAFKRCAGPFSSFQKPDQSCTSIPRSCAFTSLPSFQILSRS